MELRACTIENGEGVIGEPDSKGGPAAGGV